MNMLPINAEWKRRIKWAEQQRKQQTQKLPSFDLVKVTKFNSKVGAVNNER